MASAFLMLLLTASSHAWGEPSAVEARENVPLRGEMASACFHRSLALLALNFRTSLPAMFSEYPAMAGEVKSLAGVRVCWKIVLVMVGRSIAIEMAWRRSEPSLPEKWGRFCGMVNDWKTADGWLNDRSPRSDL